MKRIIIGIVAGIVAGILDVTPMIIQGLTWDANLSAFSMWVVIGFLIAVTDIKVHPILKGILLSFLSLIPCAVLIAWKEPFSLVPISAFTLVLGGLLGFVIQKLLKKQQ